MATVTRENIGLLNDKLTVTVTAAEYLPGIDKALKNYSKNANLPGFRKGMVPTGLIKKMYGQSVFTDEVLKSVEKGLFDYLDAEKLDIFAQPIAADENEARNLDHNNPKDYTFGFEIGLKPTITPADLAKATLTQYKVTVTDEMVNDELAQLQRKHGKMTDPETVTSEDNVLNVSFSKTDAVADATSKDNSLLVKYFTKAYQEKLMGAKNGDSFSFTLQEAFEGKELEWVLQDLGITKDNAGDSYKMDITKVGLIEPAELDEAFYTTAFPNTPVTNEAEAKELLKKDIEQYYAKQTTNQLQDIIYHYLIDNTTVEFPERFLKKWMQTGREKPSTAEAVEAEYPQFSTSLKWTLISDQLSKTAGIKVLPEDITNYAKQQLMGYMGGMALDEANSSWVNDYAAKMMQDKKFVEDTYHRVSTEKLFDWAVGEVTTKEQPISVEDFTKLVQEHKH